MVDKVRPLKIESSNGGTEEDVNPTETNPAEDYLATKGIAFEGSDNFLIDVSPEGELRFKDSFHTAYKTFKSFSDRATHTGTQLANTISNFASTVLATALTGLSVATGTEVIATDTVLIAIGKLQKQISDFVTSSNTATRQTVFSITTKEIFNVSIPTRLDAVEYFKGSTQTTINRFARTDLTYSGDNVTSEIKKLYSEADGTTVIKTYTTTYTYTNGEVTGTSLVES